MANSFTLADIATFEKDFKPVASATATPPADEPVTKEQTAADGVTSEPDSADSPAAEIENGDLDNVDSSAAADVADAPDDSETADLTSEADQQPQKAKSRAQARIEALVADKNALKAQVDYLQNQVLTKLQPTQTQDPQAGSQPVAADEAAPTLESCGYDTDKWTQAMNAWTAKRIEAGVSKAVQTVQQNQTEATRRAAFDARMATFAASTPDLQVVLGNPNLPQLHKDTAALVVDSDVGPQILYHLGKNTDLAARIARQIPVQQAAAIGRLEAQLSIAKTEKQKNPTNITRAPNPPTPTSGRGNTPSVDPNKMTTKQWVEWDRQQTEARQRARKG